MLPLRNGPPLEYRSHTVRALADLGDLGANTAPPVTPDVGDFQNTSYGAGSMGIAVRLQF